MVRSADIEAALQGRRSYRAYSSHGTTSHVAFVSVPCGSGARDHLAALVFDRNGPCDRLAVYFYARLHRLTGCEERVLAELSTGADVSAVAGSLGVKPNTARTHVRRILEKTGEANLRKLIARLGRLPPVSARVTLPSAARGIALPGRHLPTGLMAMC